jgi:hypothetical protein
MRFIAKMKPIPVVIINRLAWTKRFHDPRRGGFHDIVRDRASRMSAHRQGSSVYRDVGGYVGHANQHEGGENLPTVAFG